MIQEMKIAVSVRALAAPHPLAFTATMQMDGA